MAAVRPGTLLVVGAALAIPLVVVLSTRKKAANVPDTHDLDPDSQDDDDPGEDDSVPVAPAAGTPGKPIVVGPPSSALVAPYIAQLALRLIETGTDIELITPVALTVMTKAPKQQGERPVAIPPQDLWPGLAKVAGIVSQVVKQGLSAVPLRFTGYRPKDYNAAVGGAPKSRHIFGDAIDVWLRTPNPADREKLRMGFARYIVTHKNVAGFGFGVYTNDIHIDVGRKPGTVVTWEQGRKYIDKAKAELNIS